MNKTKSKKIIFWLAFTVTIYLLSGYYSYADELWGCVSHQEHKLFGRIYVNDVTESSWNGDMPQGWIQVKGPEKTGKYYFDLGRVKPIKNKGSLIFQATRWDFINSCLQDGFTEEAVIKKIKELRSSSAVQFKEDLTMADAKKEFDNLDKTQIQEITSKDRKKIDFSLSAKGVIAIETTTDKLMKLFVENYGSACFISAETADHSGSTPREKYFLVKIIEHSWRADLDGDSLIDIQWNPISHVRSASFEVLLDYSIGLVKIYER
ncbi:MAG: hypothetical protein ACOC5S_05175 [Acidobacteriota bacterium]